MTDPLTSALGVRLAELTDDLTDTAISPGPVRERGRRLRARRRALGASVVAAVAVAGFGISSLVAAPRHDAIPAIVDGKVANEPRAAQLDDVLGQRTVWLAEGESGATVCASMDGSDEWSSCYADIPVNGIQIQVLLDDESVVTGSVDLGKGGAAIRDVVVSAGTGAGVKARTVSDARGRILFALPRSSLHPGTGSADTFHVVVHGAQGRQLARLDAWDRNEMRQWSVAGTDPSIVHLDDDKLPWSAWSVGTYTCLGVVGFDDETTSPEPGPGTPYPPDQPRRAYPEWCAELGEAEIAAPARLVTTLEKPALHAIRVPADTRRVTLGSVPVRLVEGGATTWALAPGTATPRDSIVVETEHGTLRTTLAKVTVLGVLAGR